MTRARQVMSESLDIETASDYIETPPGHIETPPESIVWEVGFLPPSRSAAYPQHRCRDKYDQSVSG